MRAAALQFAATPFDRERNLATAARLARAAVDQGAQLLVLPELFNTGLVYSPRLKQAAEAEDGPTLAWLGAQSRALGAHLAGTLLLRRAGRVHNVLALAAPDGRRHLYAKRYPFLWERCSFEPGRLPVIAETALGRLGLLVCWDTAHPAAWAGYAGQVEAVLVAAAPARLHRAVLNFPGAQKVYLAQLLPALLRERENLDELFSAHTAACAAALGVPVVQSVMAGRFVTPLPLARFSLLAAAWRQPRYWPLVRPARLASLRATFYGGSAIYGGDGAMLAQAAAEPGAAPGDEGLAVADLPPRVGARPARAAPRPRLPGELLIFERLLRPLAAGAYRQNRVA
jgi:predicted amidohydrolase